MKCDSVCILFHTLSFKTLYGEIAVYLPQAGTKGKNTPCSGIIFTTCHYYFYLIAILICIYLIIFLYQFNLFAIIFSHILLLSENNHVFSVSDSSLFTQIHESVFLKKYLYTPILCILHIRFL